MRLTTFTDYALRVLLHVATAPEGRATVAEVARAYAVSEHHLVKVVHRLGQAGLLSNTRGHGGGLRLARAPDSITVGEVVRRTEGDSLLADCFGDRGRCALVGTCRLVDVLREADAAFYQTLDRYTLRDLLGEPRRVAAIPHRMGARA